MAENNSNNPAPQKDPFNKKAKKPNNLPKFNFYWIYGIIVVTFLAMQFAPHDVSLKTTKTKFFTEMLPSHDIEKIVVVNKERVDIYIKKESLKNAKYSDLKSRTGIFASTDAGPHYFFEISDVGSFETDLTKRQEAFPADERLIAETATQHNYLADIIGWLLPFALLIGLWMFVMRRMGGGGGGGGGQI